MQNSWNEPISIAPDVIFQHVAGETVLLDLKSEKYFGLNELGTRLWSLMQDQIPLNEILKRLHSEYQVEYDRLETDVVNLLEELQANELISDFGSDKA